MDVMPHKLGSMHHREGGSQSKTRQVAENLAGFEGRSFVYAGKTQFGIIAAFPTVHEGD
jgi:hypothetical protein